MEIAEGITVVSLDFMLNVTEMVVSATRYVIFERTPQVGGSTPFFAFFYE
jgi:hypothetical protein